ncbi:MAG TPA: 5-(carboxyamino)imidazole ribonucleotide mutase, partial [Planctomycetes bacterium]|nr:5-(carboxyamino)imidazole ribonucleotide mutase [Planctomycetota bacterium]
TVAVGKPGAANAGYLAAQILALSDAALATRLQERKARVRDEVLGQRLPS